MKERLYIIDLDLKTRGHHLELLDNPSETWMRKDLHVGIITITQEPIMLSRAIAGVYVAVDSVLKVLRVMPVSL